MGKKRKTSEINSGSMAILFLLDFLPCNHIDEYIHRFIEKASASSSSLIR